MFTSFGWLRGHIFGLIKNVQGEQTSDNINPLRELADPDVL